MNMETQIEFHKIRKQWENLALTECAKEKIRNASYFLSEQEVKKHLRDTTDGRNMIEKLGMPPLQNVTEQKEILLAAEKGGMPNAASVGTDGKSAGVIPEVKRLFKTRQTV